MLCQHAQVPVVFVYLTSPCPSKNFRRVIQVKFLFCLDKLFIFLTMKNANMSRTGVSCLANLITKNTPFNMCFNMSLQFVFFLQHFLTNCTFPHCAFIFVRSSFDSVQISFRSLSSMSTDSIVCF